MTGFAIKGWCPTALNPMLSGDGWLVRIKPPLARLSPFPAQGLAQAALTCGNGLIDLTTRGSVQLRGISEADHPALIDALEALDLINAPSALTVTPFWHAGDSTEGLANHLAEAMNLTGLPDKFGFALDSGPHPVLTDTSADIRVERDATGGLILRPDGSPHGRPVDADTLSAAALDLTRWFITTGGVQNGRGRMAAHLARVPLPAGFTTLPAKTAPLPDPGPTPQGALFALEFGQIRAETLNLLAALGPLRVTPWRMLLIEGANAPDLPGLITTPNDPIRRVTACAGAPFCPQALQPTRDLARQLAPLILPGQHLHVSGCAKGCAHSGPADLTLCGTPDGFTVIRNGTARDKGEVTGVSYHAISRTILKAL